MAFCRKCGNRLDEDNIFCPKCGQPKNQIAPMAMTPEPKHGTAFYVGCVVGVLLVAGIGYYVTDNWNSSTIKVNVHTTLHVAAEVDIYVYIDGSEDWRVMGVLPQSHWYKTSTYTFSMFEKSKSIEVKAIAIGGGLGTTIDSKTIIVTDGSKHELHLHV